MSTFDPTQHPRGNATTGHAGQFATKQQTSSDVSLSPEMTGGTGTWSPENIERAARTITLFDGVDSVDFARGVKKITQNGREYEALEGRLQYKGHPFDIEVIERMGTGSGTGYITVKNADQKQIAHSTYWIPRNLSPRDTVFPNTRGDLGNNIEGTLLSVDITARLRHSPNNADAWARTRMDVHTTGGKAWVSLPGETLGNTSLYYHGGRKWRGYGGIAFGDQAAQRESVIRGLGRGSATRGRKMLRELDQVMKEAQATHDHEYPPTPEQLKRRKKA
ncbi:hypothetical protein [Pseudoclavibacter soli]|uniref:hypothetical protein n=1 Tax=Pseudoclavibacter soli TaxID=452623 RepID=UPI00040A4DAD|nr:hypothetical protein [Pseudoclavibacter soli]